MDVVGRPDLADRMDRLALTSYRSLRVAQNIGSPGGTGALHNVNLDESYPGPRWWPMSDMQEDIDDTEDKVKEQFRYNPSYSPIGDVQTLEPYPQVAAIVPGWPKSWKIRRDRQQAYVDYTLADGTRGSMELKLPSGEVVDDWRDYSISSQPLHGGQAAVLMTKTKQTGASHGIFEVNGRPSTPGAAFIDEDARTSWSMNPEWLDDPQMMAGRGNVGAVSWEPSY